jgi:hypothetical protein
MLVKCKRNGMNILKIMNDLDIEEIVSNAYPNGAYFTRTVSDELRIECEKILGFKVARNYEELQNRLWQK